MEETFPILVAAAVAMFAWGVASLVMGLLKGERRRLAERLSGTSGGGGAAAALTSGIVTPSRSDELPPALARFAFFRGLHRRLVHAYPDTSVLRFLGLSAGLSLGAGMV